MDNSTEIPQSLEEALEFDHDENTRTLCGLLDDTYQAWAQRLAYLRRQVDKTERQQEQLRSECRELEEQLGIFTDEHRVLEASLFIDWPFLQVATLRGDKHPEELFGLEAWKGWLAARIAMQNIDELTVDMICNIHKLLAEGMPVEIRGRIRDRGDLGSDYSNLGSTITFTEAQMKNIDENPLLHVRLTEGTNTGFIVYPAVQDSKSKRKCISALSPERKASISPYISTSQLLRELLEETCRWYAQTRLEVADTTHIAAMLQRKIVSIHPFEDGNGRLSRLLMQWVLTLGNEYLSILQHPEDDLYFDEDSWKTEVEQGQRELIELIGRQFYSEYASPGQSIHGHQKLAYFQFYQKHTPPPDPTQPMRHDKYHTWLQAFEESYRHFADLTQMTTRVDSDQEFKDPKIVAGGLIPHDYIKVWGDTRPHVQERVREVYFYPGWEIYRGGACKDIKKPEDLLNVFTGATGFTSSYRPIALEHASPMSIKHLPRHALQHELASYNALLLGDAAEQLQDTSLTNDDIRRLRARQRRIDQTLPRTQKNSWETMRIRKERAEALDEARYIEYVLTAHTKGEYGDVWTSPGISASTYQGAARAFCVSDRTADSLSPTLLLTSRMPYQGAFYSPDTHRIPLLGNFEPLNYSTIETESEVVVIGGIDPNSVDKIEMYTDDTSNLIAFAYRTKRNRVILVDVQSSTKSIYSFDKDGRLVLRATENLKNDERAFLKRKYGRSFENGTDLEQSNETDLQQVFDPDED